MSRSSRGGLLCVSWLTLSSETTGHDHAADVRSPRVTDFAEVDETPGGGPLDVAQHHLQHMAIDSRSTAQQTVMRELNQYSLLRRLGRGAQGEVFLAMDGIAQELRAIKAVARPQLTTPMRAAQRRRLADVTREVSIMKQLRHRNIVRLYEVIDDPSHDTMYLVLQYVEHGPLAALTPEGAVSATTDPVKLISYARQICSGLHYLHRNGVIHRDIKPENILLGANEAVYLSDFGTSELFGADSEEARRVAGTRGTPAFLAPELLLLETKQDAGSDDGGKDGAEPQPAAADGEAVDVWALGITLYALLYGKLPWEFTDARDLFEAIQRRPIELRPQAAVQRGSCIAASSVASVAAWRASGNSDPEVPRTGSYLSPQARDLSPSPSRRRGRSGTGVSGQPWDPLEDDGEAPALPVFTTPNDPGAAPVDLEDSVADAVGAAAPNRSCSYWGASGHQRREATLDEGWRRILHGMLQRSPARRTKVVELRRQLASLEHRLSSTVGVSLGGDPDNSQAYAAFQSRCFSTVSATTTRARLD